MKGWMRIFVFIAFLAVTLLVFNVSFVYGLPSETRHTNTPDTIKWEEDGIKDGNAAHNHRSSTSFNEKLTTSPNNKYDAFAVWDNTRITVEPNYYTNPNDIFESGHGFINELHWIKNNDGSYGGASSIPAYTFDAAEPPPDTAKTKIREAFAQWGGIESDKPDLITGLAFREATPAQITIRWRNIDALGTTDTTIGVGGNVIVTFDSDPDHPDTPDKEEWWFGTVATIPAKSVTGEAVGTGDGATKDFYLLHRPVKDETVYIDGVKQTRDTDYTIEYNFPERVKITFKTAPKTGAKITADYTYYNHYHFFSTALHEIGHVVGLDEQTDVDDVMIKTRLPGPGPAKWRDPTYTYLTGTGPAFDSIDTDSIDGARDLYSIPAPDLGDAPDPYPWASHQDFGYEWLGDSVDGERLKNNPDPDDDGVKIEVLQNPLRIKFTVTVSTSGKHVYDINNPAQTLYLNAWIDWNNDRSWAQANEHVISDKLGGAATKTYTVNVPAGINLQNIGWIRFRLDYGENVGYEKAAFYGEVEDYKISGVGGIIIPTDKFALLTPYISLASTVLIITAAIVIYAKHIKRRNQNDEKHTPTP